MKRKLAMMLLMTVVTLTAWAQSAINGTVVSASDGEPIIGATVKVKGASQGAVTDVNGKFSIKVEAGKTLVISYVGMRTVEQAAKNGMRVQLGSDDTILDEIVVTAYGTQKKQSVTGSVSQINADEIEKRVATSATAALEGAAPGVQINNTYGEPGAAPTIRIRGFGSMENNSPLIVVDGVAFDGNISEINANDIESMSVLKDAASAALYGNRAANGVILITTKSGRGNSKPVVTLNANVGFYNRGIPEYERLEVKDWMQTQWTALKNMTMTGAMGLDAAAAAEYATKNIVGDYIHRNIFDKADDALFDANGNFIANILPGYTDLDWNKDIERTGIRQDYTVSAQTATEKMSIFGSVGYLKEDGYIKTTGYERWTARVNSSFNPTTWLKFGVNVNGTVAERNYNSNAYSTYYSNPFYTNRMRAPIYPYYMHDKDGNILYDANNEPIYDTTSSYLDNRNINYEIRQDKQYSHRNVLNAQSYATILLPYGFNFTVKGDVAHSTSNNQKYDNPEIGDGSTNNGRLTSSAYRYTNYTAQEILNWSQSYGQHNIDAMVGHENYKYEQKYTTGMNTGMAVPNNLVMGNFLTNSYFEGYDDEDATESYLARARYNYDEKYFVEASWRRDGSSRFHPDNRWGNFYSFGASWNAKKESFLQDVSWLDALKVRASYGEVGNNAAVSFYGYMALYEIGKNAGQAALLKQSLSAPDIKWETTQTVDLGVEGRVFNMLNFSIGYFDKRSKDLLFAVPLPLSIGGYSHADGANMSQWQNIGTISNRGFEVSLDADILKNKDFSWNLGIDATFLKNKLVKLPGGKEIPAGVRRYAEGHSIYEFWTYHFEGIDQMDGHSLYTLDPEKEEEAKGAGALREINGTKYATQTTYGLRDWRGSALPKVYGSFHTDLRWKGISLSAMFTYSLGGKVIDYTYQSLMSTNTASSADALHKDILNSWNGVPAGMTETSADRVLASGLPVVDINYSSDNNAVSDRWLTSASYLVFKNLNIAYDLPKSLVNKLQLTGLQFHVGGENLFTLSGRKGMNPQYSFNGGSDDTYVTARIWNVGLTVKF